MEQCIPSVEEYGVPIVSTPGSEPLLYPHIGELMAEPVSRKKYAATFRELMEAAPWEDCGRASGNPQCQDCMAHSGYEPSAVHPTFATWRGLRDSAVATLSGKL